MRCVEATWCHLWSHSHLLEKGQASAHGDGLHETWPFWAHVYARCTCDAWPARGSSMHRSPTLRQASNRCLHTPESYLKVLLPVPTAAYIDLPTMQP